MRYDDKDSYSIFHAESPDGPDEVIPGSYRVRYTKLGEDIFREYTRRASNASAGRREITIFFKPKSEDDAKGGRGTGKKAKSE